MSPGVLGVSPECEIGADGGAARLGGKGGEQPTEIPPYFRVFQTQFDDVC